MADTQQHTQRGQTSTNWLTIQDAGYGEIPNVMGMTEKKGRNLSWKAELIRPDDDELRGEVSRETVVLHRCEGITG